MRFRHFYTISPMTGKHKIEFEERDYKYMGVAKTTMGMPLLEAHVLVNKWNKDANGKYVYWLEDQQ